MNTQETCKEIFFDKEDKELIDSIKRKDKRRITIYGFVIIVLMLLMPITPDRSGNILIHNMSYLNAIAIEVLFILIVFVIPLFFFMQKKYKDYRIGKKIVLQTRIKDIKQDKLDLNLSLTSPYYNAKWIFLYRDKHYQGIAINDLIMISYLPKTKYILEINKIK